MIMKVLCNISKEQVYLKEPAAAIGEIWECRGIFYLIAERFIKYGESDYRYKIYPIYPIVISDRPNSEISENEIFTFVCSSKELDEFFTKQYIKTTLPYFNYERID